VFYPNTLQFFVVGVVCGVGVGGIVVGGVNWLWCL